MARKKDEKMQASEADTTERHVRLTLSAEDFERLKRAAKSRGITLAGFARQSVLRQLKEDEAG